MLPDDHRLARRLAESAGELLVRRQRANGRSGRTGWWLGDEADVEANTLIVDEIQRLRADDALLSEESPDDPVRLETDRTWIIDPLDGSSGFGQGYSDWAVHVALTQQGDPIAASVAVPAMERTFSADDVAPPPTTDRAPIVVVGRTRAFSDGAALVDSLGGELAVCSSAGVKAMLVVSGAADIYAHAAPLYEWDVCAPAAIATAAGLTVSDRHGQPIMFNQSMRPIVDGLVICAEDWHRRVIDAID